MSGWVSHPQEKRRLSTAHAEPGGPTIDIKNRIDVNDVGLHLHSRRPLHESFRISLIGLTQDLLTEPGDFMVLAYEHLCGSKVCDTGLMV